MKNVIVKNKQDSESFLEGKRIQFDEIIDPLALDLSNIDDTLSTFLETKIQDDPEGYLYIYEHMHEYNREFCGFVFEGDKYICCNMFTYETVYDFFGTAPGDNFTHFMDGGVDVVFFVFDISAKEIIDLKWNGVA